MTWRARWPLTPRAAAALVLCGGTCGAMAQDASSSLREVTVSVPRGAVRVFDLPGSVDTLDAAQLSDGRAMVNLSESLGAVPGLLLQNRQNHAQDLQLSIRGFGARSTFGVRGVRLYVDGIPATLPDGQGQTSHIDIGSTDRVEILRGPFSALYGNASGGVLQTFTETGAGSPLVSYAAMADGDGTWRQGLKASGSSGAIDYVLASSRFATRGWREQSAAQRDLTNGKLGIAMANGDRVTLVFNRLRIDAQDPLGLDAAQYALAPRAAPLARQYDTRKTVAQTQAGMVYERRIAGRQALRLMLYGGERATTQFQSIPPSAQQAPGHAGGVIDLGRGYGGLDLRWTGQLALAGRPLGVTAGLAYDSLREQRRGYENFTGSPASPLLGMQGRLRRDERNGVWNLDPYAQATWRFAEAWSLEAGVRRSGVHFSAQDRFITAGNGDDSGGAHYRQLLPVASLRYAVTRDVALYASAGRGFETPTLNELSYRPDGAAGLNFALRPSVNDSVEVGGKARVGGGLLTAAVFETRTQDEIVTGTNTGGRTTFQNAGRTARKGFELAWQNETADAWRTQWAWTWLDARYSDAFCAPAPCTASTTVAAGNRIPGTARNAFFAALGWMPSEGWRAGTELRALSRIPANDRNTAAAPGYAVAALQAGYVRRVAGWEWNAFARVDNVFDRRYAGSVIVNEGNGRYYEPAQGRNWMVGFGGAHRF